MPLVPRRGLLAITAVLDIALNSADRPVSAKALADRYHLAPRHLEPLLQALVHQGVLRGIRGPRGGYELGRDPHDISLLQILEASLPETGDDDWGPMTHPLVTAVVKPALSRVEQTMTQSLREMTLHDLAAMPRPDALPQT